MVEDIVIIAAGMGTRLSTLGDSKPLVEVQGKSLIEHALFSAFSAGIKRATVITGYEAPRLYEAIEQLKAMYDWQIITIHNPYYMTQNGLSVLAAKEVLNGKAFFLTMCDHIVEPALYHRLLSYSLKDSEVALAIDQRLSNPFVDLDDVTKVNLGGKYIKNIGKHISTYSAFDTGVFLAGSALFSAIETAGQAGDYSISGGMNILAQERKAIGVDIGNSFWIDVDSPAMHDLATEWAKLNLSITA